MKTAVVTLTVGHYHEAMGEYTHPLQKRYASRIGADYLVIRDAGKHVCPHYQKLELGRLLEEYDRILYLDTDILISPLAPDLFALVPPGQIALLEEGRLENRKPTMQYHAERLGFSLQDWDGRYFNTGVIVFEKCHREVFCSFGDPNLEIANFYEQTHFNYLLMREKQKVFELPKEFNHILPCDAGNLQGRLGSYFIHYAGMRCEPWQGCLFALIQEDLHFLTPPKWWRKKQDFAIPPGKYEAPKDNSHPWFRTARTAGYQCNHSSQALPVFEEGFAKFKKTLNPA